MVDTSGKNILNAINLGSPVKAIYNNGVQVWPPSTYSYYIKWEPSDVSGSFTMEGVSHYFTTYMGYYTWSTGVIDSYAFSGTNITSMETNAISINDNAFNGCTNLTYAADSNCSIIGNSAFYNCTSLDYAYFSNCTKFGNAAFQNCPIKSGHNLGDVTEIGTSAFKNAGLDYVVFSYLDHIPDCAFEDCQNLSYVYFSDPTYFGSSAFRNCTSLQGFQGKTVGNVNFFSVNNCSYIGSYAFDGCTSLFSYIHPETGVLYMADLYLPSCTYIGAYAFRSCGFNHISIPICPEVPLNAFNYCRIDIDIKLGSCSKLIGQLRTSQSTSFNIYLYSTSMVQLTTSDAFVNAISNIESIYVPVSLVTQYRTDSLWSWYSSVIKPSAI